MMPGIAWELMEPNDISLIFCITAEILSLLVYVKDC